MAGYGNQEQLIAQMQWELEAARNRIDALAEQSRKASEEIARLRNQNPNGSFRQQNDLRPPFGASWSGPLPPPPPRPPAFTLVPIPQNQPMQLPTSSVPIPTIPPQAFPFNGEAAGSSQQNGFPNPGFIPLATNVGNSNDPVAQRLKMLEDQNERVLSLLAKLPGAAVPVDVEPHTGFQASPFVNEIALVDVPKKYSIPAFTPKYSGITDPTEHIAQYKQLMWTVSIPYQYQEVCMCKSFGATLTGAALQWLINLKPKSVGSFAELVNQFSQQFASSRKMEKQTSDLYYVV